MMNALDVINLANIQAATRHLVPTYPTFNVLINNAGSLARS